MAVAEATRGLHEVRKGVRSRRAAPQMMIEGDAVTDELAVVELTEDLIALSQRYSDTGQVGTVWLSRSQLSAINSLMDVSIH